MSRRLLASLKLLLILDLAALALLALAALLGLGEPVNLARTALRLTLMLGVVAALVLAVGWLLRGPRPPAG
ncbi:MAG TPA: hypothetical protein VFV27_05275 [Nevskiaceae bacterium]|nr:hypothetical protein [Nevskiaceae bacterium]